MDDDQRWLGHAGAGERGTALVLVPALALVVVGLATLVLDAAAVAVDQRTLVTDCRSAAAAAAAAAVDLDALHRSGQVVVDARRVDATLRRLLAATHPDARIEWRIVGATIEVRAEEPASHAGWWIGVVDRGTPWVRARATGKLELVGAGP